MSRLVVQDDKGDPGDWRESDKLGTEELPYIRTHCEEILYEFLEINNSRQMWNKIIELVIKDNQLDNLHTDMMNYTQRLMSNPGDEVAQNELLQINHQFYMMNVICTDMVLDDLNVFKQMPPLSASEVQEHMLNVGPTQEYGPRREISGDEAVNFRKKLIMKLYSIYEKLKPYAGKMKKQPQRKMKQSKLDFKPEPEWEPEMTTFASAMDENTRSSLGSRPTVRESHESLNFNQLKSYVEEEEAMMKKGHLVLESTMGVFEGDTPVGSLVGVAGFPTDELERLERDRSDSRNLFPLRETGVGWEEEGVVDFTKATHLKKQISDDDVYFSQALREMDLPPATQKKMAGILKKSSTSSESGSRFKFPCPACIQLYGSDDSKSKILWTRVGLVEHITHAHAHSGVKTTPSREREGSLSMLDTEGPGAGFHIQRDKSTPARPQKVRKKKEKREKEDIRMRPRLLTSTSSGTPPPPPSLTSSTSPPPPPSPPSGNTPPSLKSVSDVSFTGGTKKRRRRKNKTNRKRRRKKKSAKKYRRKNKSKRRR
jgi:hypothetical protein